MVRRRFYAPPVSFQEGIVSLSSEESRHLRDVLRLKNEDEAFVFDGRGNEYSCKVQNAGHGNRPAILEVNEKVAPPCPESLLCLTLGLSLLKGEKFDLVVQKATELGVTRIIPVMTTRSEVRLTDNSGSNKRVERWRRLALEACKQAGRSVVPEIESPIEFKKFVERASGETTRLMFAEACGRTLSEVSSEINPNDRSLTALIGPEGGWDDDEIDVAKKAGWKIVTMGGRIVRAETAAIVVIALLQHAFGDLK